MTHRGCRATQGRDHVALTKPIHIVQDRRQTDEYQQPDRDQGEQNEDNNLESHPLGRIIRHGVRAIFAGIQPIHPLTFLRPSPRATWVNVHIAATALCFFGLFGMAGLYARQVEETGWLGLAGFLLFGSWMALEMRHFLRRSLYPAAVGDRVAGVCERHLGDV